MRLKTRELEPRAPGQFAARCINPVRQPSLFYHGWAKIILKIPTLLFFPALMVFAAFSDLLTMMISNRVSIALTLLFIALAIASGLSTAQISWHLASGALILIVGFGLFAGGWIGGGDAKLAAPTARM